MNNFNYIILTSSLISGKLLCRSIYSIINSFMIFYVRHILRLKNLKIFTLNNYACKNCFLRKEN